MTYQAKVYRAPGGNELVVASSGKITIQDGGLLQHPVVADTSAAALANNGISTFASTTAVGNASLTIDAPVAGQTKVLVCTAANSSDTVTVMASTAVSFTAGSKNKLVFSGEATAILFGLSATRYALVGSSTLVVASS